MDFTLIADFADVLAAVGIIASLAFVAFQVRQNTNELRNAHWESVVQRVNMFHSRAFDKETAIILDKGKKSYRQLEDPERLAFEGWMHEFVLGYGTAQTLIGQGILKPEFGRVADQRARWLFRHAGAKEWWRSEDRVPFAPNTAARIDELMKEI